MTIKVIDTHAHVVLGKAFGKAGKYGPETGIDENGLPFFRIGEYKMKPMQYENTIFMENNLRIEAMDKLGIDLQLLSPNPLTMFHKIEGEIANEFCKIHNDAMVESINLSIKIIFFLKNLFNNSIFSLRAARYNSKSVFFLKLDFLSKINFLIFSEFKLPPGSLILI